MVCRDLPTFRACSTACLRPIERTGRFDCDDCREFRSRHRAGFDESLAEAIRMLAGDLLLEARYHDHVPSAPWTDLRDWYVEPDLVPIYRCPAPETLPVVHIGSHAALGL